MPKAPAVVLVLSLLVLPACGEDEPTIAASPTATPIPVATATPTPEPTPTQVPEAVDAALEPPELQLVGEDFEAIMRSMEEFRSYLFRHEPDPEALHEIYWPECECWEPEEVLLTHYRENGLLWQGARTEIVSVEVVDHADPNLATVRVVEERRGTAQLVDEQGEVHRELHPRRVVGDNVLRRDSADAPWRLLSYATVEAEDL